MIDWNFLLLLGGGLLIGGGAMAAGYFVGKHNAYVEMIKADIEDRHERLRQEVERLKSSDSNNPDHRVG